MEISHVTWPSITEENGWTKIPMPPVLSFQRIVRICAPSEDGKVMFSTEEEN